MRGVELGNATITIKREIVIAVEQIKMKNNHLLV